MAKHPPRTFYLTEQETVSAHMSTNRRKWPCSPRHAQSRGGAELRWRERTPTTAPRGYWTNEKGDDMTGNRPSTSSLNVVARSGSSSQERGRRERQRVAAVCHGGAARRLSRAGHRDVRMRQREGSRGGDGPHDTRDHLHRRCRNQGVEAARFPISRSPAPIDEATGARSRPASATGGKWRDAKHRKASAAPASRRCCRERLG